MFNIHQLKKLTWLSKLVEQKITYHCMNSPAWNEETKEFISLVDHNGETIDMANPSFTTKVSDNGCNVSM